MQLDWGLSSNLLIIHMTKLGGIRKPRGHFLGIYNPLPPRSWSLLLNKAHEIKRSFSNPLPPSTFHVVYGCPSLDDSSHRIPTGSLIIAGFNQIKVIIQNKLTQTCFVCHFIQRQIARIFDLMISKAEKVKVHWFFLKTDYGIINTHVYRQQTHHSIEFCLTHSCYRSDLFFTLCLRIPCIVYDMHDRYYVISLLRVL